MERNLILQANLDNSLTKTSICFRFLISSFIISSFFGIFAYLDDYSLWYDTFLIVLIVTTTISILPMYFFIDRRLMIEKGVMLEAMGAYEEAMMIASKYATPSQMAVFRSTYQFQLKQLNQTNVRTNQVNQTSSSQAQSTTHNQINPIIHIHNTQTQQGPNQNYIQDSVVTDWNQR